jgi:hypothetical protein
MNVVTGRIWNSQKTNSAAHVEGTFGLRGSAALPCLASLNVKCAALSRGTECRTMQKRNFSEPLMGTNFFAIVTLCCLLNGHKQRFGRTFCLQLQNEKKMEVEGLSEMLLTAYQTTQRQGT